MTFTHLSGLLGRFRDYPPERVRLKPAPGTATRQDVLVIGQTEGKLGELIGGVLVEKAGGSKESLPAHFLGRLVGNYAEQRDLGIVLRAGGTVELLPGQDRIPDVVF